MSVTHARALITKHHKYAWVFTLSALLIVGGIYFKKDLAQAATYTFTQTSWMGGVSATTAVDPTDRTGWTKYSTSTSITAGSNVALVLNSFSFTDDGATSTTPTTTAFGGGFSNGATSSTIVTGVSTTTAASVGLAYAPITNVSEIKTGSNTTCVVKTDSTAYCWGLNNIGQLGDNTTVSKSTGVQVHGVANSGFLTGVAQISSGISTTCAVKTDGTVYCWGNNSYGQLGDNTTVNKSTPVQVLGVGGSGFLTGVAQISTGGVTTCALKTDGTVYCWGRNFSGQLGDNTTVNKSTPVQVLGVGASGFLTGVAQISTGQAASTGSVCAVKTDGTLYCWGENSWAQLGDNTTVNKSTPVQVHGVANSGFLTGVAQISTGGNTICALKTDGTAYCWGYNDYGQIGDNTTVYKATPVQVHGVANSGFLTGVAQISTGGNSQVVSPYSITCAVKTDGTAYCWGSSFYGQLGDNTTVNKSTPVQVHGVANSGFLTGVAHIKIGGNTICALKTDGTAYCWGYNNYGQIGDNTTVNKSTPVQPLLNFYTSGTFTSAVINLGAKANLTTFSASTTIPAGTAITFDVRAGDSATPPAWGSTDSNWTSVGLTGVSASSGSISALGAHQYIQYRANLTTPSPYTTTPTLGSVTINNIGQYTISGNLTSSAYDTGDATNLITKLSWVGSTTTTETIKFQVQSSADGVTWSGWCGGVNDTTCNGSTYFTDTDNGVSFASGSPLRNGGNDKFLQYKVFLTSGGATTPSLTSVTAQYVVNAPPVISNVTASQGSSGTVTVGYDVADADTVTGVVDVTLQYCPTGSTCTVGSDTNWVNAVTVSGVDSGTGVTLGTGKSIVWTPAIDYNIQYNASEKIRVKTYDREGANAYGYGISSNFTLDTTAPVVSAGNFLVDSTVGNAGLAGIKLVATDATSTQYRLCNNANFSADGLNSGVGACTTWSALVTSLSLATSTTSWNTTGAPNAETVYAQVRDAYGNVANATAVAPAMPTNFITTDTTNLSAGVYREFLSWGVGSATNFGSYKIYYNTTGAGSTYSLLGTVTDVNQNYYTDTITTATSSTHYYKMVTTSSNGDISDFTAIKSDVPDGSGSTDVTPPYIPVAGIAVPTIWNTSAHVTFSTYSDVSMANGELATSTIYYGTYDGVTVPSSCPATKVATNTYTVNQSIYLTGLTPGSHYYFCVTAKDMAGNISSATTATGGTFTTVTGPVISNVTEREITDTSALIFWTTDTSSDSKVSVATTQAGVDGATPVTLPIVTVAGTDGKYQHQVGLTGLVAGATYYFMVSSTDASTPTPLTSSDDNSDQYYSFVTLRDTTPPTISGIATPVLSSTAAVIVWQTDEPATTQVSWGLASTTLGTNTALDSTKSIYHVTTLSSATGAELTPATTYYYTVKSSDAAGNLSTSGVQTFKSADAGSVTIFVVNTAPPVTAGVTPDTTPPVVSDVKIADITPFTATVSFTTDEAADAFLGYGKDTTYGKNEGDPVYGTTHTVKLSGLTLGTEYHIAVTAHDKAGNIATSPDQTFKTSFLADNLKDLAKIENIEQYQKELEDTIASILPSLVPPFVSKPQISAITETGATVTFSTNIKAFPVVGYVEDGAYDATKDKPYTGEISDTTAKGTAHTLNLTNLKTNTKYHLEARAFSLPQVIGKSSDVTFVTKASKIAGSIVERKKDSFTVVWTTPEPTTSIVEYKNLKSGITERKTDDAKKTTHSMKIENLPSGTSYSVDISGVNENGNTVDAGSTLSVTTSTDVTAPTLSGFKVDNALVPGRTDRIQTIVSWTTDEPGNSVVYFEEGAGSANDGAELANKQEVLDSYVVAHSVIIPSLKPGTIYRLKVTSSDDSGNVGSFGPRTVITPKQTESITDIIFKNFEDSFKFLRKI